MLVFLGFAVTIIFGFLISHLIAKKLNLLERLGLSYPIGMGIFTFLMFIFSWAGIEISLPAYSTLLIAGVGVLMIGKWKLIKKYISSTFRGVKMARISFLEKILIAAIASMVFYTIVVSLYSPVVDWDSLVLYDFF